MQVPKLVVVQSYGSRPEADLAKGALEDAAMVQADTAGGMREILSQITSPTLFFWGLESFLPVPETDPRFQAIRDRRLITVPGAGHWVHHDQLDLFLRETSAFLLS